MSNQSVIKSTFAIKPTVNRVVSNTVNEPTTNSMLLVKRLSSKATLPTRADSGAAGYDLYSAVDGVIPANGRMLINTDISVSVPEGTYGRIAPRSGLTLKYGVNVGAGVIDFSYRGPVGIILFNHTDTEFKYNVGDRVAQLILEQIINVPVQEVSELNATSRGSNGFGSSGK